MTEDQLEQEALGWLAEVGYSHRYGPDIAPDGDTPERADYRQVLLPFRLREAIHRLNPQIPASAREDAYKQVMELGVPSLLAANRQLHKFLVNGVPVQYPVEGDTRGDFVRLIDWAEFGKSPSRNEWLAINQFSIKGAHHTRRPDIILFINGLPLVLIELKNPADENADIWKAFDQLQTYKEQIADVFQYNELLVISDGSEARLGSLSASAERFMQWRTIDGVTLDPLGQFNELETLVRGLLAPAMLLDYLRYFVLFEDDGTLVKKVAGYHQFHAVRAAIQQVVTASRPDGPATGKGKGGVVWHTQGSGKSILMVLLAKWLLEHDPEARILVITDRDELDKQIVGVMRNAGVIGEDAPSPRITSRQDFVQKLGATTPRLLCALIHKFDVADLKGPAPAVHGRFYVFVDECHRTQGGDMNKQMKRWLESAIFIGFTGTPLLRKDKLMTRDVFGTYIHTYKFHQAVADKVVLDLKYEARDVPERLTSQKKIDEWFEQKTKHLNNFQKAVLRKRWATMEELMSAGERKQRIIANIIEDFSLKPRLNNNRGTAILVAASIYDACHYFRLFQNTSFGAQCGIITSFEPNASAISKEPPNSDERYKFDTYTKHVLKNGQTTKVYEDEVKRRFKDEPANMKLLIVVSKLLTGFDAPSCTYIYLDNELRDHNLFQAICRTNRLDGDDKDYGHIVDYKKLFGDVQQAIAVYSSDELDIDQGSGGDNNVRIKNWLEEGKKQLDEARQALVYLCEPVALPREVEQYLRYFCGDAANANALNETEPLRVSFYKAVATFARAYADLAQNLTEAGYTEVEAVALQKDLASYTEIRAAIKKHSGEELDIKPYEADMRHLINTYIQADSAEDLGELGELSLTELIIKTGIHDAIAKQLNAKGKLSKNAIAEGIINNVRKTIIRDQLTDPKFYAQMSTLLDDLIKQSREDTAAYEEFLRKAEDLVKRLAAKQPEAGMPAALHGKPEAIVIYNNLPDILAVASGAVFTDEKPDAEDGDMRLTLALEIDRTMRERAPAGWKGDQAREAQVLNALYPLLGRNRPATQALFELMKNQPGYL